MNISKLLKIFTISFLALSAQSCGTKAPPITVCIIRVPPEAEKIETRTFFLQDITAECTHADGTQETLTIDQLDKYVAIPQDDAIEYIRYCGGKE